jgi:predicted transcriptional regulator
MSKIKVSQEQRMSTFTIFNTTAVKIIDAISFYKLSNDRKCSIEDISQKSRLSYACTYNNVKYLESSGFLNVDKKGRCTIITLTPKAERFIINLRTGLKTPVHDKHNEKQDNNDKQENIKPE